MLFKIYAPTSTSLSAETVDLIKAPVPGDVLKLPGEDGELQYHTVRHVFNNVITLDEHSFDTPTIFQNLNAARQVLMAIPPERLDLMSFREESPYFSPIVSLVPSPVSDDNRFLLIPGGALPDLVSGYSWLDQHFGPWAFHRLFACYGLGEFDRDVLPGDWLLGNRADKPMRDKALALFRIGQQAKELST